MVGAEICWGTFMSEELHGETGVFDGHLKQRIENCGTDRLGASLVVGVVVNVR